MSTLDDIAKERQLLAERLARIDGERAKVAEQIAELEAAERVLSRCTKSPPPRRPTGTARPALVPASAGRRRGQFGLRRYSIRLRCHSLSALAIESAARESADGRNRRSRCRFRRPSLAAAD